MYKLNRRVTVTRWVSGKNSIGSPVPTISGSWDKWAQVDERDGRQFTQADQQVWAYDAKIVMRYEKTRPTQSNMTIEYEGARYVIQSVSIKTEGHKKWEVCRCSKVDIPITQS